MKNILSSTKTVVILLIVAIISLSFYTYMLVRPISYGMRYINETENNGQVFISTMIFQPDGTVININTNYDEPKESFYYYKNGYLFLITATTEEGYNEEIAYIDNNFDEAIATPFYASKINAFNIVYEGFWGYDSVFICDSAKIFAVVGGVVELIVIALTTISAILWKRNKCKN